MTPLRMRLFIVAFIVVAAAISTNALYLQNAPRLAGNAMRGAPEPERTAGATASLPKQDVARSAATAPPAPTLLDPADSARPPSASRAPAKLIKAIQRELSDRGYSASEANGLLGLQTRAAIIACEFDEDMPLTGEASEAVLKSLIFGKAAGKGKPGPAGRFERRLELVGEVRQMLLALGFDPGPSDGRLDAKTREAIRQFESARHLQADGRLTERVLLEIVIATGRPLNAGPGRGARTSLAESGRSE